MMKLIEMIVDSVRENKEHPQPNKVVILREREGERYLPIWVVESGAESIAVWLQGINLPRPLTHDFIIDIINTVGLKIDKAIINKLEKETHYAILVLSSTTKHYEIDCRPSDALAVAIRANAPVFADEEVLKKAAVKLPNSIDSNT
ncbi:MAG: bifunctional nuclease family protein [Dehalococcoidia bacterium]|nr:MAG: bifunctional nuclease family protein [Dehalococcoidia bacterium]